MKYEKLQIPVDADEEGATRTARRAIVSLPGQIKGPSSDWRNVRVTDLSATGFSLWWHEETDPGKSVRLRISGMSDLTAEVRWTRGRWIGCRFDRPLSPYVFEHIAREA